MAAKRIHFISLWLAAVLLFPACWAFAQNQLADSLKAGLKTKPAFQREAIIRQALADLYREKSLDSALRYGRPLWQHALAAHNEEQQAAIATSFIRSFAFFHKPDSAMVYMARLKNILQNGASPKAQLLAGQGISTYYEHAGKADSAVMYLIKCNETAMRSGDHELKAMASGSLCEFYSHRAEYDKALPFCLQAAREQQQADSNNMAAIYTNTGNVYFWKLDYNKALEYYQKAYQNARKSNSWPDLGYVLNNIGLIYGERGQYQDAIPYFSKAMEKYRATNSHEGMATAYGNLAQCYFFMKQYDSGIALANRAIANAAMVHDYKHLSGNYETLADIYAAQKDYKSAYESIQKVRIYSDSLKNKDQEKAIASLRATYDLKQQENENKLLLEIKQHQQDTINRQLLLGGVILALLIFSVIVSVSIYRSRARLGALNVQVKEQNSRLEKEAQYRMKLFSLVSHDFKSPLSTLNGYLYLLENGLMDKEELNTLTEEIGRQLKTTSEFADNLLNWSRSHIAGYVPDRKNIALAPLASQVFDLYGKQAQQKNTALINNIDPLTQLTADPDFISMVLRNLVSNAIKFTEGGTITIACRPEGSDYVISVTDTGAGMTAEDQAMLSGNRQFSREGTASEKGTSMGLLLSREFIEANGGKLMVQSEPGKGSTFSFSVPGNIGE